MNDEKVQLRFVTKYDEFRVTESPFAVPIKLGRSGLSEVINHLLESVANQPFDFMIGNMLLRQSLKTFFVKHKLSFETITIIEYMPAVTLNDDSVSAELPAWIGAVDCTQCGSIFAGCFDGRVQIVDRFNLAVVGELNCHEDPIRAISIFPAASSNLKILATASKDQMIKLWKIGSKAPFQLLGVCNGHVNSVESMDICSEDCILLTGDWSGNIFGWNISSLTSNRDCIDEGSGEVLRKRRRYDQSGGTDDLNSELSIQKLSPVFTVRAHAQSVTKIQSASSSGRRIFSSSWDHSIKEWDMERQDCVATFAGSKVCTSMHFSSESQLLASSHPDGKVRLWDPRQREETTCLESFGRGGSSVGTAGPAVHFVSDVRWHPSSAFIFATSDYEGKVRIWDTRAQIPLGVSDTHDGKALCVNWLVGDESRGGEGVRVISGGSDCMLKATSLTS